MPAKKEIPIVIHQYIPVIAMKLIHLKSLTLTRSKYDDQCDVLKAPLISAIGKYSAQLEYLKFDIFDLRIIHCHFNLNPMY